MGFMATIKAQKAYSLHGKGQTEEAKKVYEEAIAGGLDQPRYFLSYSVLLIRSGEFERARDILKKAEKLPGLNDEQKTQLFTNYAACMYRLDSLDKGINLLEKRHIHAPAGMLYQTLGYLYVEKFDPINLPDFEAIDQANQATYEKACDEARSNAEAAGTELILPDPPVPAKEAYLLHKEKAGKFIEESIDYDDEDTICLDNMGQWYYRVLGDKVTAKSYFEKAIELKEDQIDTLWFLSRYDLEEGNNAKALERLNTGLGGRFSALNYKSKQDFTDEIARIKAL